MRVDTTASLLRAMTEAKAPYVLLRDVDAASTDVDLLAEPSAAAVLLPLAEGEGLRLLWRRHRAGHEQLVFACPDLSTLWLDVQKELRYGGMRWHSRSELLSRAKTDANGVRVLPEGLRGATLLAHCAIDKGVIGGSNRACLERFSPASWRAVAEEAGPLWPALSAAWEQRGQRFSLRIRWRVRVALACRRAGNAPLAVWAFPQTAAGQLRWWASRPGMFLALLGTDGTGKTTQSQALAAFLSQQGIPAVRLAAPGRPMHPTGQPRRVPAAAPSASARLKARVKAAPLAGPLIGVLTALRFCIGWWLHTWFRVYPRLYRGRWVVLDRYVYDVATLAHPLCRWEPFLRFVRWCSPRPDRAVYLWAAPRLLEARAGANDPEETVRQLACYERVSGVLSDRVHAGASRESVLEALIRIAYAACAERQGAAAASAMPHPTEWQSAEVHGHAA